MKQLKIIFMGTPQFAVTILAALLDKGHTVVAVITAPDRQAGRGRQMRMSAVKTFALEQGLKVLQPTNLKDGAFIKTLRTFGANLQIVVAFRMLPRVVWSLPEYGTFNLHASLLPDYRGAAPINWVLMNGEKRTGVTTFFIDDAIDTGAIIAQRETPIHEDDTAGILHDRLMHLGAELVLDTVVLVAKGDVKTQEQPQRSGLRKAHKIFPETCRIPWHENLDKVYNHIRGLSPYPVAWTILTNGDEKSKVKIYHAKKEMMAHGLKPGTLVLGKKEIKVAVNGGFLQLLELQLEGRRRMKTASLLNGLKIEKNAKMA